MTIGSQTMKRSQRNGQLGYTHSALALLLVTGTLTLALHGCNDEVDLSGAPAEEEVLAIPPVESWDTATIAQIARGGRLYDNWMKEANIASSQLNGARSATGTYLLYADHAEDVDGRDANGNPIGGLPLDNNDDATFRCKTCHGWDYKGVDGRYGSTTSDNYTGFIGVLDAQSKYTIQELEAIISDGIPHPDNPDLKAHKFGTWLTDPADITALAMFIKYGVMDANDVVWTFTGWGKGDAGNGKALYNGPAGCSGGACHEDDGKGLDFDDADNAVEFVGTLANDNPWEMIHKIRFGDAGEEAMPSIYISEGVATGLTTQDAIDVLTHTQSLPVE
jgi:thiosulfate dehydrogenase